MQDELVELVNLATETSAQVHSKGALSMKSTSYFWYVQYCAREGLISNPRDVRCFQDIANGMSQLISYTDC
jgi:hypothetical protein